MEGLNPEILQFLTSVGVSGVLIMWLWDVRGQLREEKAQHQITRQELKEALKDCNREDTRRIPRIPESERDAYKSRLRSGATTSNEGSGV